ncbi:MAG TPA: copper chaperone CopZ [Virgibacillus sp.]|nr:copper chaperone CopZ [Virgibacillus sp.]
MEKTVKVQGMSCGNCVKSIEESVGELTGVSSVKAKLESSEVTVGFDNDKTTLNQIIEVIEDQGYDIIS